MTTKNWYQSKTIGGAIAGVIISIGTILGGAFEQDRSPNEKEIAGILGILSTASVSIYGRYTAKTSLKVTEKLVGPTPEPDYEYIASLTDEASIEDTINVDLFHTIESEDVDDQEELEVKLVEDENRKYYLVAKTNTKLKTTSEDSINLDNSSFVELEKEVTVDINSWTYSSKNSHLKITLASDNKEYFVYAPHIKLFNLEDKEVDILPSATDNVFVSTKKKTAFNLPGMSSTFYLEDPIVPKGHFTWAEATKGGTRLPINSNVVNQIVAIAKELEKVRTFFGNKPIKITSWYRPPAVNRAVGGASRSKHLEGHAVDFYVVGMNIYDVQKKMQSFWKKGGLGLGANKGFIHIDLGSYRVWYY